MLRFEHWETPPIKIIAVQLTEQNIEEVSHWVGAGQLTIEHDIENRRKRIEFRTSSTADRRSGEYILRATVGDFVALEEAHVDRYGDDIPKRFHEIKRSDIHKFLPSKPEIPAAPYDN